MLITRGSNAYGPYQYPEKLIPLFVTNLLEGEPVPVYGDGLQVRDWLHVDDHARGIAHVLEHGTPGEVYNVGGGNSRTNLEITQELIRLTGRPYEGSVRHVTDRQGHDRRYALDSSKAQALGWSAVVPFANGLAETVAWCRDRQEAVHTPFLGDRALALENARYVMTTARNFGDEIEIKPGGKIERRARDVLAGAVRLLDGIAARGLLAAIEDGTFADVKRRRDGGRGYDGVFAKAAGYWNPFADALSDRAVSA